MIVNGFLIHQFLNKLFVSFIVTGSLYFLGIVPSCIDIVDWGPMGILKLIIYLLVFGHFVGGIEPLDSIVVI